MLQPGKDKNVTPILAENARHSDPEPQDKTGTAQMSPVKYIHRSETINGLKQEINILEIDPGAEGVRIQPVLSHDLHYGFEKLSEMAARKKAYAAINSGFFYDFGLPSGMVVINGELVSASSGRYPVFVIKNGKTSLKEIRSELAIEYEGGREMNGGTSGAGRADNAAGGISITTGRIMIDILNFPADGKQTAVYTPVYGKTNRAKIRNITATIINGVVTKVADYNGRVDIPSDGMLVTFYDAEKYAGIEAPLRVGDKVKLLHQPEMTGTVDAYECGSWLVCDGKQVAPLTDAWVGVMTNRDPRTAIGIKEDGTVILLTVDGRQPGYSAGFTAKELAEYLISCGSQEAAMLDGGASTEMIVEGRLVGRPSFKGEERPLGGGIVVLTQE
ncbi:MAG: phosphodiester glycosidase family protein [Clostridiaceae bacterium]